LYCIKIDIESISINKRVRINLITEVKNLIFTDYYKTLN
jgi:hypothetical protein